MKVASFRQAAPFLVSSAVAAAFAAMAFAVSIRMGFMLAGIAVMAFYEGVFP